MIAKFVVYDIGGKILRYGSCPSEMVSIQAGANEFVLLSEGNDTEHKVVNGVVVPKSKAELDAIAAKAKIAEDAQKQLLAIREKGLEILDAMAAQAIKDEKP